MNSIVLIDTPSLMDRENSSQKNASESEITMMENSFSAEEQVVQALKTGVGRQILSSQAEKHFELEVTDARYGSIIIQLSPKGGNSLQKLKQSCATGNIKDFLPNIFMGSGVENTLGEGAFRWKVSIYVTPYRHGDVTILGSSNKVDAIKIHWKLLVEEMNPWTLLADLQAKGLLGKDEEDEMLKLDSRKDRMKFLLTRLLASKEPDLIFEVLLEHCQEHNEYVYQRILEIEGLPDFYEHEELSAMADKTSETERESQSDQGMIYSTILILRIRRKQSLPTAIHPGSDSEFEICHLDILEPVCYFDFGAELHKEEEDADDLQNEVVMVLEQVQDPLTDQASVGKAEAHKEEGDAADLQNEIAMVLKQVQEPLTDQASVGKGKMAVVKPAGTLPFDANPEQTPSVTKQEMKSQFHSSEGPIKMVENATVFRPDSRKKNVNNFPVLLFPMDSWQKFEDAYIKGQTNDHLHSIFEQMGVAKRLGKGVLQLKLSIHLMPHCDTETGREPILLIKEILNRIRDTYLKQLDQRPHAEKIGEQVLDYASRKENLEFLLKRLFGLKGINSGLKILKEFCATYPYITKRIDDIMGKRAEDESLLGQELFTANITLDINMTESTGDMKMNIVVEDPKLLFDTVEDARKAVSFANDHKIVGALFCIDCDTPKKNEEDARKAVSFANDHKIIGALFGIDCDTTKENEEDARKAVSFANDHKIVGALFCIDCDTPKKNEGEPPWKRKKSMHSQGELHRNVLNRMLPKLVLDLDVDAVSMFVQEKELFHDTTMYDILEQKTSSDKTRELIKQIQKRDPDTYKKFKECLVKAKQKFLKDLLEEEEQKILLK